MGRIIIPFIGLLVYLVLGAGLIGLAGYGLLTLIGWIF